jgi:hypothetical protein
MGLFNWLLGKKKVKFWKGKPLYRKQGESYWKGYKISDDLFNELMHNNPEEVKQYNYWVRRANRSIRRRYKKRKLRIK